MPQYSVLEIRGVGDEVEPTVWKLLLSDRATAYEAVERYVSGLLREGVVTQSLDDFNLTGTWAEATYSVEGLSFTITQHESAIAVTVNTKILTEGFNPPAEVVLQAPTLRAKEVWFAKLPNTDALSKVRISELPSTEIVGLSTKSSCSDNGWMAEPTYYRVKDVLFLEKVQYGR